MAISTSSVIASEARQSPRPPSLRAQRGNLPVLRHCERSAAISTSSVIASARGNLSLLRHCERSVAISTSPSLRAKRGNLHVLRHCERSAAISTSSVIASAAWQSLRPPSLRPRRSDCEFQPYDPRPALPSLRAKRGNLHLLVLAKCP